jgi:hypothetical protein
MALWPGPTSSCFYLDPAAGLTDGNLWKDSSPYGLHVTPVNYAAPNYGLSLGPSGAPRITFDGASQYGTLPLRFFNKAPGAECTFVVVARYSGAVQGRIFCARSAGLLGFEVIRVADKISMNGWDVGGTQREAIETNNTPLTERTRVSIVSSAVGAVPPLARCWQDGAGRAVTSANNGGVWTAAVDLPCVGRFSYLNIEYLAFDLYHLAIYPLIFTHQEALACSAYWMDRC